MAVDAAAPRGAGPDAEGHARDVHAPAMPLPRRRS